MNKRALIIFLCIGACLAHCPVYSEYVSLDDVPWRTIKGLSLGSSREMYANAFGSKHTSMPMGPLELWPASLVSNQVTAGLIRDGKVVALMWTWNQLPEGESRVLTTTVFDYLAAQDPTPNEVRTEKVVGERIASVLVLIFQLPELGASARAVFTSSEIETAVIIHDGTSTDIEEAATNAGGESLPESDEQPIIVRDYLNERLVVAKLGNENRLHSNPPPMNPLPSTPPSLPKNGAEAISAVSAESEKPVLNKSHQNIVVLIVSALCLLLLLLKRKRRT